MQFEGKGKERGERSMCQVIGQRGGKEVYIEPSPSLNTEQGVQVRQKKVV